MKIRDKNTKKVLIKINPKFFRPEVLLLGDSKKAKKQLKWTPKVKIKN